jgi:hypothetical protein
MLLIRQAWAQIKNDYFGEWGVPHVDVCAAESDWPAKQDGMACFGNQRFDLSSEYTASTNRSAVVAVLPGSWSRPPGTFAS